MALIPGGIQHAAPLATGTQDYSPTVHGSGSTFLYNSDCKGGLIFSSRGQSPSTSTSGLQLSLGMFDGASQGHIAVAGADAATTTAYRSKHSTDRAYGSINTAGTDTAVATAALITNGLRLNFTTVDTIQPRILALMFGGPGVEVQQVNSVMNGTNPVTVNHSLTGAPTHVYAMTLATAAGSAQSAGGFSLSMYDVANDKYSCYASNRTNGVTTEAVTAMLSSTYAMAKLNTSASEDWKAVYSSFGSASFVVTPNATAGTSAVSYLLVKFPNSGTKVVASALPTDTTEAAVVTGCTVQPKFAFCFNTLLTAVDVGATDDTADWFGISAAWLNNGSVEAFCTGILADDGQTGTNNTIEKSLTASIFMQQLRAGNGGGSVGSISQFTDDGAKWTFSTVNAAAREAMLMVAGDTTPTPQIASVTALAPGASATITGVNFSGSGNSVMLNGVSQTITGESTISITITVVQSNTRYGEDVILHVANSVGNAGNDVTVQLVPETGTATTTLVDPLANPAERLTSTPDLAGTNQVHIKNPNTGIIADISIGTDGTINSNSISLTSFDFRTHDGVSWSGFATVTLHYSPLQLALVPDFEFRVGEVVHLDLNTYALGESTISVVGGTLPPGVTLDSGIVSGTCSAVAHSVVTFAFVNAAGSFTDVTVMNVTTIAAAPSGGGGGGSSYKGYDDTERARIRAEEAALEQTLHDLYQKLFVGKPPAAVEIKDPPTKEQLKDKTPDPLPEIDYGPAVDQRITSVLKSVASRMAPRKLPTFDVARGLVQKIMSRNRDM